MDYKKLSKELLKLYNQKKPKNKEEHIGIEIECFLPKAYSIVDFAMALRDCNLLDNIDLAEDASINAWVAHKPVEIRCLFKYRNLENKLELLCNVLKAFDFQVNQSCGLHVHLDMRSKDPLKSTHNLVWCLPVLKGLISKSRKSNAFCRFPDIIDRKSTTLWDTAKYYEDSEGHYDAINLDESYRKHKTVEVRIHQATLNFYKLFSWIKLLRYISNIEKLPSLRPRSAREWIKLLGLDKHLSLYVEDRLKTNKNNGSRKRNSWNEKRKEAIKRAQHIAAYSTYCDEDFECPKDELSWYNLKKYFNGNLMKQYKKYDEIAAHLVH